MKFLKTLFLLLMCWVLTPNAQADTPYSYNAVSEYLGQYLHAIYLRDVAAVHCDLQKPPFTMPDRDRIVKWALKFYQSEDLARAKQQIDGALPEVINMSYAQAQRIFQGFAFVTPKRQQLVCNEMKRLLEYSESNALEGLEQYGAK